MNLPIVDAFNPPYIFQKTRAPTPEEIANSGSHDLNLLGRPETIDAAPAAAEHFAKNESDQCLNTHIKKCLNQNSALKEWQRAMPPKTP